MSRTSSQLYGLLWFEDSAIRGISVGSISIGFELGGISHGAWAMDDKINCIIIIIYTNK